MALCMLWIGQEFNHCHETVHRNRGQEVPPAMKLQQDTERQADLMFPFSECGAKVDIDIPETICEECIACQCRQLVMR